MEYTSVSGRCAPVSRCASMPAAIFSASPSACEFGVVSCERGKSISSLSHPGRKLWRHTSGCWPASELT